MKLLILGATGEIGILLTRTALKAGYELIIYARSPEKLPADINSSPMVTVLPGQLTDRAPFSAAVQGVDAVLSVLGPIVARGPLHPSNRPLAHAYNLLLELMYLHGVTRLIALGSASITDPNDKTSARFWSMVKAVQVGAYNAWADVVALGKEIRAAPDSIRWTIVRVPFLNSFDNEEVVAGYIGDPGIGTKLSRKGYVSFVMKELENKVWLREAPMICNP